MSAFLQGLDPPKARSDGDASAARTPEMKPVDTPKTMSVPPPVNRAGKPKIPTKPASLGKATTGQLSAPENNAELSDRSASPFSTPPSSGHSSPGERKNSVSTRGRVKSDASFVQHVRGDSDLSSAQRSRVDSDASWVQRIRGDSDLSSLDRTRTESNASFVEPSSLGDSYFQPPPTHHAVVAKRDARTQGLSRAPTMPARYRPVHKGDVNATLDGGEEAPRLPARPELQMRRGRVSPNHSGRTSPTKPRSGRTSPSKLSQQIQPQRSMDRLKRAQTFAEATPRIPASKPTPGSALGQGFSSASPSSAVHKAAPEPPMARRSADIDRVVKMAPEVPAPRRSLDARRTLQQTTPSPINGYSHDDVEDTTPFESIGGQPPGLSDFPDSSHANRRPPRYRQRPYHIPTDYDTRLLAVCGEYAVTTGYITKAWNLRTGEELLNMAHNENVKCTALVFKPSSSTEDEGKRVWLGTSIGEIHEVDIVEQRLIKTKTSVHTRKEIVRMSRHASQLWTLDSGGELNVWKADHKGMPSLDSQYATFRVTMRDHTFSIACGDQLWIATGKELRVYRPGVKTDAELQVTRSPLSQSNTGDITAGTTISSKPDLIYFGHADGKVSIYNRREVSCLGVINVSLYKISSLAGVGDSLWAGFNTGMAYVYDVNATPWRVKKDWQAHDKQICSIIADPSAVWKLDRLQVVTLGTENMLRLWDGMLEEDWLESRMHEHDSEYCSFREITAAVLTWNAGATKPGHLQHNKEDNNFFREYLAASGQPDILVFGFQELVDLEDKKVTAKSFFKSKKKDPGEPEHQGHQYRAWRDHLTRCIDEFMPTNQPYTLLHTASMVGLFTCVFVKTAERSRIKHVHTAEIKRGMGGLHGNKGALVLRVVLDDSSICFMNCHLAAGQTQTIHRNNDIAAILESEALPANPLPQSSLAQHADVFTSGGDGSMILDHEICILNGDLNYRIDTMGRDTVVKHIYQGNLARLLERDQLLLSKKKNPGFRLRAFQESPIKFAPTYKYNVNTDDYDTSEKRRAPAWCDRILYRGLGKVKMDEYHRWEVRVSDHRPVSGRLRLRVKTVNASRREPVWELCQKEFEEVRKRIAKAVQ